MITLILTETDALHVLRTLKQGLGGVNEETETTVRAVARQIQAQRAVQSDQRLVLVVTDGSVLATDAETAAPIMWDAADYREAALTAWVMGFHIETRTWSPDFISWIDAPAATGVVYDFATQHGQAPSRLLA